MIRESTLANAMRENCLSKSSLIASDVKSIKQPEPMLYDS